MFQRAMISSSIITHRRSVAQESLRCMEERIPAERLCRYDALPRRGLPTGCENTGHRVARFASPARRSLGRGQHSDCAHEQQQHGVLRDHELMSTSSFMCWRCRSAVLQRAKRRSEAPGGWLRAKDRDSQRGLRRPCGRRQSIRRTPRNSVEALCAVPAIPAVPVRVRVTQALSSSLASSWCCARWLSPRSRWAFSAESATSYGRCCSG